MPSDEAMGAMCGDSLCAGRGIEDIRARIRAGLQFLWVDLEGALLDWESARGRMSQVEAHEYEGKLERAPRNFARVRAKPGAVEAVKELSTIYHLRLMAAPQREIPHAWDDKCRWVERRLPHQHWLTPREKPGLHGYDDGDYLVDGVCRDDAASLAGELILLGSEAFPDWPAAVRYLKDRRREYLGPTGGAEPA